MLRRTRKEVGDQLPPVYQQVIYLDHDENKLNTLLGNAISMAMQYDGVDDVLERGRLKRVIENETRRMTGVAKASYVAAFVRTLLESGHKVLLFAWHHDVFDIYEEHLGEFEPGFIVGTRKKKHNDNDEDEEWKPRRKRLNREAAVEAFKSGNIPLLCISLRASAGLNLPEADVVVFGELDWTPPVHTQAVGRTQRDGQEDEVMAYFCVINGGCDEPMMDSLGVKTSQIVGVMGGHVETEEDKMLSEQKASEHMESVIEMLKRLNKGKAGGGGKVNHQPLNP